MMTPTSIAAALLALCTFTTFAASAAEPRYRKIVIDPVPGAASCNAVDVNERGQVLGQSQVAGPFIYTWITGPNGQGLTILDFLPGSQISSAARLNDSGIAVGTASLPGGATRAFMSTGSGSAVRDIGTLGGPSSSAADIDAAGRIVGTSDTDATGNIRAFITGPGGTGLVSLGTLDDRSTARAINEAGVVTGLSFGEGIPMRAFVTDPGGGNMREINGDVLGLTPSAINDRGLIAGAFWTNDTGRTRAMSIRASGEGFRRLGVGIAPMSVANDVNNRGAVVGQAYSHGRLFAFAVLARGGRMLDLTKHVEDTGRFDLTEAGAINERGQIAARNLTVCYLLDPIS